MSYKSIEGALNLKTISHYTSVNSILKILKTKTLLFNRIDKVNDVEESAGLSINHLSERVFISCFNHLESESIPLWFIYTSKGVGVRISLTIKEDCQIIDLFDKENSICTNRNTVKCSWDKNKETNGGFIKAFKCQNVMYLSDSKREEQLIIDKNELGVDFNMGVVAGYKDEDWEYEAETRFVAIVSPNSEGDISEIIDVEHILMPLNLDVLESITITFDPWMSDELKDCIKNEIYRYGLVVKIEFKDSNYTQKILRVQ